MSDLDELFRQFGVELLPGEWQFETIASDSSIPDCAVMMFREREGLTLITRADARTAEDNRFAWLEITVHSDLNAVGFLARISAALADANVPCNAIAGYHHDHIFVPVSKSKVALVALNALKSPS